MDFIFEGKIIAVLAPKSGTSAKGEWFSQEYVIEDTSGQYPKKMCFNVFGRDKVTQMGIVLSEDLIVHVNIDAQEYQGRWFNKITAWKVERPAIQQPYVQQNYAPTPPSQPEQKSMFDEEKDDLPF
jgi:hypothetical protein